ncbi:MAG: hypothetical protein CMJ48_12515 [Planctomycetaceae bacterium]|nr:hypothetical protein [Planctomycetaceae bacterium]
MNARMRIAGHVCLGVCVVTVGLSGADRTAALGAETPHPTAGAVLEATGVQGGLVVHVGCGNGKLIADLATRSGFLVQGLDSDAALVEQARARLLAKGRYGTTSVDRLRGSRLPFIDNHVNLVVAEELGEVSMAEVMRVLCPQGVAYIKQNGDWTKTVKPRPDTIDEWTHYLHDASNNAVAHDSVVAPPERLQWVGGPKFSRHHDRMSSLSAEVSAGGRVFYIFDEASRVSILLPPKWRLIARDAFNGTVLWKRDINEWQTHLWPLKSGPAQLPRRLIAFGDRVYLTLSLNGPFMALDAATGKTVRTYEGTDATEEAILSDGVLYLLVNRGPKESKEEALKKMRRGYNATTWDETRREILAFKADSGELLWQVERRVLPVTLAADVKHLIFHDGESVVCLDRKNGTELWRSKSIARADEIRGYYAPTLVLHDDVVLFSGGETAGKQTGSWYTSGKDTLTAVSAKDGKKLWESYHPPSGYRSPEDVLVSGGLVWTGETTSGRAEGVFTGRDPHTGEVKQKFAPDVDTYWFHHRCYRGKATDNFLLMSRTGIEFLDINKQHWTPNHWVRGACSYGVMPANGLVYAPQHPCACYLEAKLVGMNALAPAGDGPRIPQDVETTARLEKGPAYSAIPEQSSASTDKEDWPTLRHDAARSGSAGTHVPASLTTAWQTELGGKLTSPVVAGGRLYVASIETHTVHAVDATSGGKLWSYTVGGRVDSPPTIYEDRVLFGSADGSVYYLRADDGALAWRFLAAPMDQRLMSMEQIESVWPVHGNVMVLNGEAYFVSGRSMFLDGGLRLWRLDPRSGRVLSKTVLNQKESGTGKDLQEFVSWLNMPPALPDVASSNGRLVYMRSQPFNLDGTRLPLEAMPRAADDDRGAPEPTQRRDHSHVFSPTGFLDDSWFHRSYWMYGSRFVSGWCGYFLSGKAAPAGRILVFDDSKLYGFARKPQYYRWTTPIEHHLFSADKLPPLTEDASKNKPKGSKVRVDKSKSLSPAATPLTVEAWIEAEQANGVVLARGGNVHGYSLFLQGGRPRFATRSGGRQQIIAAKERVTGRWAHVAGVLTADKELQVYVNGKLSASTKVPELLTGDPAEGLDLGADDSTPVGDYTAPHSFTGLIDEVRIYSRALTAEELAKRADRSGPQEIDAKGLALSWSFDDGKVRDASGNGNHGQAERIVADKGKVGAALRFVGDASSVPGFLVKHHWTQNLPLFARAMLLAQDTLFVAGPADLVDEEQAFRKIGDEEIQARLEHQAQVLAGKHGATLRAVATEGGGDARGNASRVSARVRRHGGGWRSSVRCHG